MAAPFTITSVSNYNSNPPSDDGAQTASNRLQWSTQKTKLADPIKTAFDTSESNTSSAFGKVKGGGSITTTAISYTVTASDQGKYVKATASGITITTPDATVVGSPFVFSVLNASSGDITLDGNGTQTVDGDLSFAIPAGCGCEFNTDGTNWFTDGRNFNNVLSKPQGYLTPTSGTPLITGDVTAATSVYYTPYEGDRVPISTDGTTFKVRQFSELTLTLVSNHLSSTIYDVFLFDNSGTITIATGPAWNNSVQGTGSRGTGAGTTELQRVHGLYTNKNSMTARNGTSTYTVAANEGTYIGSIYIDGTAGQVSCYVSWGSSRKWGIWNAFNRANIILQQGDATASWSYTTGTWRQANAGASNFIDVFTGLAEETFDIRYSILNQLTTVGAGTIWIPEAGIGYNSTSSPSGIQAIARGVADSGNTSNVQFGAELISRYIAPRAIGINRVFPLENGNGSTGSVYVGTSSNMILTASYRG